MFDAQDFVTDGQAAATEVDPVAAVQEVVASAIADGASIDAALGTEFKAEADTLFSSVDLTVQRIQWPPGIDSSMHDHRMWAVVGVYVGQELNRIYRRSPDGIEERGHRALGEGDVLVLDEETPSIRSRTRCTGGLPDCTFTGATSSPSNAAPGVPTEPNSRSLRMRHRAEPCTKR